MRNTAGKQNFEYNDQHLRKEFEAFIEDLQYHKTRTAECIDSSQRFLNSGVGEIKIKMASAESFPIIKNKISEIFLDKKHHVTHVIDGITAAITEAKNKIDILKKKQYFTKAQELEEEILNLNDCIDRLVLQTERISEGEKKKVLEIRDIIEKTERARAYKNIKKRI